ncbi:MAG: VCBS repeat-containing protein [Cyclobacteriaceae bacterium]|nr:VCBS repeat-containing protein [Cyclobacteriaceae bacterium]UYN88437.1 MAG: VCBS repeat-containing protein [Cyclobacteriaceae bacterium]
MKTDLRLVGHIILPLSIGVWLFGCNPKAKTDERLFDFLPPERTGIKFRNDLVFDEAFNIFTYRNFYNGGGVGIGDFNKDGLPDIYFTCNQGQNKLYLNKGDFRFEDITEQAGVGGSRAWSTGVAVADINGDGLLDIYVCNSGDIKGDNKQNELFINNGDLTFSEQAERYGLADQGFSTHAVFFDYDNDGDLDLYLLNNSYQAIGSFNLMQNIRHVRDSVGGDKLFRNDGDRFTDVSEAAGIYGSIIGFGLGITVGDVNNDGWMDIFISNDFFERDYLYINNHDGTFKEVLESAMPSISAASMGADVADINNDGWLDIFVTDMLPEDDYRLKQITTFDNWDRFTYGHSNGYHYQLTRNMLHLNNGNQTFSDISRLAGVEATDWSWGALIFDVDNDGSKDIFVANGIHQDITDLDYLSFIADEKTIKRIVSKQGVDYKALIEPIPIHPVPNYLFQNKGNLQFVNKAGKWGLAEKTHSNGAAYADLNNDGALDLVINNVNNYAFIYENKQLQVSPSNNFIKFELTGIGKNTSAIGARVEVKAGDNLFIVEQMPNRGFQSSVDQKLIVGVGSHQLLDSVKVYWPSGRLTSLATVKSNQELKLNEKDGLEIRAKAMFNGPAVFSKLERKPFFEYTHRENPFVDFDRDRLTYHMLSTQGPALAVGDVNGDGREDVFLGGARGYAAALYMQQTSGEFQRATAPAFNDDAASEDVQAIFFDFDNDGDLDLFVASGGNEFTVGAPELVDRIYKNDGSGNFVRTPQRGLSTQARITGTAKAGDFDGDGYLDLFVGVRADPFAYGIPPSGFIYRNDGQGNYEDVTQAVAPMLSGLGHITDACWTDYDKDGDLDLLVVGEWMHPVLLENSKGYFRDRSTEVGFDKYSGWWNTVQEADLNSDGYTDFVLGNHGLNSRFKGSDHTPLYLFTNDFDGNGTLEHIYARDVGGKILPFTLKHEIVAQMPSLKKKYLKYESYNKHTVQDIFTPTQLKDAHVLTANFLSSSIMLNNGGKKFKIQALPIEAQITPVYSILADDFDKDGNTDLLLGGNLYEAKPEAGRYDASYGTFLKGSGDGNFVNIPSRLCGFSVTGAIRKMQRIQIAGKPYLLIARNNDSVVFFKLSP